MVTKEPVRWAMVRDGAIENVCLWDGDIARWQPPEGAVMVPAPDHVGIGWTWDGSEFSAPVVQEQGEAESETIQEQEFGGDV